MTRKRLAHLVSLRRASRRHPALIVALAQLVLLSTLTSACINKGDGPAPVIRREYSIGLLTGVANGHAVKTFAHDERGRVAREHVAVGGSAYTMSTAFDSIDRVAAATTAVDIGPGAG